MMYAFNLIPYLQISLIAPAALAYRSEKSPTPTRQVADCLSIPGCRFVRPGGEGEALVAQAAVETLAEPVLHRLARRDVVPFDAVLPAARSEWHSR
jgi:hypothetical protein